MDQQRPASPANDPVISNASDDIASVDVAPVQTDPQSLARPIRLALRTKRTYHVAQSFDDHAWHRADSDDSDVERRPRVRRRPTTKRILSQRTDPIREEPLDSEKRAIGDEASIVRKEHADKQQDHEDDLKPSSSDGKEESDDDEYLVTWDGPDDPQNPKNWSTRHKWAIVTVVSGYTFLGAASASIVAPALGSMEKSLKFKNDIEANMIMSVFVLAQAIGSMLFAPLCELYGRVPTLQCATAIFLAWNTACALAGSLPQMLAFRFLAGIGASAPFSIGGAVLGDCFNADQRGRAFSMYSVAPLLGPALGAVCGGFIQRYSTWRWVFRGVSCTGVAIMVLGFFFLRETYAPILLGRKAAQLRKDKTDDAYYTRYDDQSEKWYERFQEAFSRPFIMLGTQPIIIAISLYIAYLYGLLFLMLSTYSKLFIQKYHQPVQIGCLHYLALGLGNMIATQVTSPIVDLIYRRLTYRNDGVGLPEFRVPLGIVGSISMPCGLLIHGWSAQYNLHWIVPDIGAAIFAAGSIVCFQSMQGYILDSYARFAASGLAASTFLRSIAGFAFPLWAPLMFDKLHYGYSNTVLAGMGILIGVPAPFFFWRYGSKLRAKSQYAAG